MVESAIGAPDGTDVGGGRRPPGAVCPWGRRGWPGAPTVTWTPRSRWAQEHEVIVRGPASLWHCTPVQTKEKVDVQEPGWTSPSLCQADFAKSLTTSAGSILAANTPCSMADLSCCVRTAPTVASQAGPK